MDELMYDDGVFDPVYELALLDEAGVFELEADEVITDKEYSNVSLGIY